MQVLKTQLHVLWCIALQYPRAHVVAFLFDKQYRKIYDNDGSKLKLFHAQFPEGIYKLQYFENKSTEITMCGKMTQNVCSQLPRDIVFYLCNDEHRLNLFHLSFMWRINNIWCDIEYEYGTSTEFLVMHRELLHKYKKKHKLFARDKTFVQRGADVKYKQLCNQWNYFIEQRGKIYTTWDDLSQYFWHNNKN